MTERTGSAESDGGVTGRSLRWRAVLRDLVLVAAWVAGVSFAFGVLRWPDWAYYLVVFGGVIAYSLAGDPWTTAGP